MNDITHLRDISAGQWPTGKLRVFLGGTSASSNWRDELIAMLNPDSVAVFNPVVSEWTDEAAAQERIARDTSTHNLYVFTPAMQGFYSVAELIEDAIKQPGKTVFFFMLKEKAENGKLLSFENRPITSLERIGEMAMVHGAKQCYSLEEVAVYLNHLASDYLNTLGLAASA